MVTAGTGWAASTTSSSGTPSDGRPGPRARTGGPRTWVWHGGGGALADGSPRRMTSQEPYSLLKWDIVERARAGDGSEFVLGRHGDDWVIRVGERILMSNRMHDSEEALADHALERADDPRSVLVGGLGLGYTLRAVLDGVSEQTEVTVAELVPALVTWNRVHLGVLADHPLDDPRCRVVIGDVYEVIRQSREAFDVILLDVDNGPQALAQAKNQRIYGDPGVRACRAALRPSGVLAILVGRPERPVRAQARELRLRRRSAPRRGARRLTCTARALRREALTGLTSFELRQNPIPLRRSATCRERRRRRPPLSVWAPQRPRRPSSRPRTAARPSDHCSSTPTRRGRAARRRRPIWQRP